MTDNLVQARPVQQIHNPVKASKWKPTTTQMRPDAWQAVCDYAEKTGFDKREIVDVALRDYLKLPEPND